MIKVGNILVDPKQVELVAEEYGYADNQKAAPFVVITFKSGATRQIPSEQIGLSYQEFIDQLLKLQQQSEDKKLLKLMTVLNNK